MDFDFALLLVVLTAVTGVIWAFDRLFLIGGRKSRAAALDAIAGSEAEREQRINEALREPVMVEYARSFFPVILIVLLFRSFLAEPFKIPSGSTRRVREPLKERKKPATWATSPSSFSQPIGLSA